MLYNDDVKKHQFQLNAYIPISCRKVREFGLVHLTADRVGCAPGETVRVMPKAPPTTTNLKAAKLFPELGIIVLVLGRVDVLAV